MRVQGLGSRPLGFRVWGLRVVVQGLEPGVYRRHRVSAPSKLGVSEN